jgi:hypothetical protein
MENNNHAKIMQLALKAESLLKEASGLCLEESKTYPDFINEAKCFERCAHMVRTGICILEISLKMRDLKNDK